MTLLLERPLYTQRLRLEPVTMRLAAAARDGGDVFSDEIGADVPEDWTAASLGLVSQSNVNGTPTRVVAVDRADGLVIGDVRFEPSSRAAREFEIGYGVARSRRRQGYALEATGAVIDWLFQSGADSIIAGCDARNIASVRTLRRLGFWLDSNPSRTFWWLITPDLRSATPA